MEHSMKNTFMCVAAATGLILTASVSPASAASALVENAKDNCVVGEMADGYIGVVSGESASSELRREISAINQQRKTFYANLARRNGVTVEVTAGLTAEKLMNQATSGQCVRVSSGSWVRR